VAILVPYSSDALASTQALLDLITTSPTVMLYVGPDQLMPLASVLSAIVGVALMFWHRLVSIARKGWAIVSRRGRPPQGEPPIEDRA
jgi:hypothetical protein